MDRAQRVKGDLTSLVRGHEGVLKSLPHPNYYINENTREPLTAFDHVAYVLQIGGVKLLEETRDWITKILEGNCHE